MMTSRIVQQPGHMMLEKSITMTDLNQSESNAAYYINEETRTFFEIVNFVFVCGSISAFGITANTINIVIFYKQGFTNTVNIGFFGVAISDFCCLVVLLWVSVCVNPLLNAPEVGWVQPEVMYISGAWPHICFCRITSFITVYITSERFLCILIPLKVKQLFTPGTTTSIISLIYFFNIITLVPEYSTSFLGWVFLSDRNQTLLVLSFTESRGSVEGAVFVIHSILAFTSFLGVIVCTTALVIKLQQTTQWRKTATGTNSQSDKISARDQKTVKMVVIIATILIVCYTPGAVIALITFTVGPEFNIKGRYTNICEAAWSLAFPFQAFNSSVNIFLYYRMSSKYRQIFDQMFFTSFINEEN